MHVVVVGASVAGVTCAEGLRAAGHTGPITLVGAEPHDPYARPPLSKQVLAGSWEPARATLRTAAALRELDVTLRSGAAATALDPLAHRVEVGDELLPYDVLVVATGVEAVRPSFPGADGVRQLRTLDDALALRAAWATARHVTVIGTGVLGSEIASAARRDDREVVVVGRSGRLSAGTVGTLLSDRLLTLHRGNGVDVRAGVGVRGVAHAGAGAATGAGVRTGAATVFLGDGDSVATDLVVAATGGRPRTSWLAGSGSGLDVSDGVGCDELGRAAPDVYAIGDVARWRDPRSGRAVRVEHQTNAVEQALSVAATITGSAATPAPTPFFWSEVHGVQIQAAGTFDAALPLSPWPDDSDVLVQRDGVDTTTGVVGWGAPRAFRRARTELDRPAAEPGSAAVPAPAPAPAPVPVRA
ncbi:NADPH-dependent 2,4-dienoyl-CoA reductase/sulfur reductase-like enzyme [Curtobacterium sp. PhB130]|nr:NADPH-dependent 2,4-dienoyl-CoA reductase/sulfur reductase-like enzyme [Curtobacterium sp. PhB130]